MQPQSPALFVDRRVVLGNAGNYGPILHRSLRNHLLASLPDATFKDLLPDLEPIKLPLGWIINRATDPEKYLYFLTAGIVGMVHILEDGSSTEIALTGNEGISGIALILGGDSLPNQAVVLSDGYAYRISRERIREAFIHLGPLQHLLLRYGQALMTQVAQSAVCYRHHSIEQQFCRWLLVNLDRLPSNNLVMTQDLIANMLGVRRESVTEAATKLQKAGCISYRRGHISVADRVGLEERVCECYKVVKNENDRLLNFPIPL